MTFILGFGHSHIVAIAEGFSLWRCTAAQAEGVASQFHYLHAPEFTPNVAAAETGLNGAILEKFAQPDLCATFLSVGGNEHNILSVLQNFGRIDFILGEEPDLPLEAGAEILTEAALREALRGRARQPLAAIAAFGRVEARPMIFFEAPPPLPTHHIVEHPGDLLGPAGHRAPISPERLRYKMWRLSCALYREACEAAGIAYLPVPPSLIDAQGMLAAQGLGPDATHANERFGLVMVKQAMGRLGFL